MPALVVLKYGDAQRSTRLVNNKLHIPTVEKAFGLSNVDVDGVIEPTDEGGFTFAMYQPGTTLQISGPPAAGLFNPLDVLCYIFDTVLLYAILSKVKSLNDGHSGFSRPTALCLHWLI